MSTRKIAQVAQSSLTGREKTKAIQEAIRSVRSPTRKRGKSDPARGKAFRDMYRAGKSPVRTKEGKILTDVLGRPITVVKRKRKRTRRR